MLRPYRTNLGVIIFLIYKTKVYKCSWADWNGASDRSQVDSRSAASLASPTRN